MPLESLLLSRDTDVINILQQTLAKLSIDVEVCRGARSGTEILFAEKFDAVIVDCDDLQDGITILQDLRKSPSNRSSIAIAILNGTTTTHQAFEQGATFVMQKPVSGLNAMRCLSAGLGLMLRERRRYFRCPIKSEVVIKFSPNQEVRAVTTNLSEGGMAVRTSLLLTQGDSGNLSFALPDHRGTIETKAEIVWVDGQGRAGVRFMEISKNSRELLDRWLEEEILRAEPLPHTKPFAH
jgi:c-di-GMP-binding flagellar brake protein YcgR